MDVYPTQKPPDPTGSENRGYSWIFTLSKTPPIFEDRVVLGNFFLLRTPRSMSGAPGVKAMADPPGPPYPKG